MHTEPPYNNYGTKILVARTRKIETGHLFSVERQRERLIQVPGIDLNFQNNKGVTAAMWAVSSGKDECVKMLRNTPGVNWNIRDNSGWSPITYAVNDGNSDILQILLTIPTINPNVTDSRGRSLYQIAKEKVSTNLPSVGFIECLLLLSEDSRIKLNIKRKDKVKEASNEGVKAPEQAPKFGRTN